MPARRRRTRLVARLLVALACHGAVATTLSAVALAQPASSAQATKLIHKGAELYDDQQYEESIQTLSAALVRPGTSVAERIEIYRLLAYDYISLKRMDEADAAVRGIYSLDETFRLPPTESPRFRDFFDATRKKWEAEGKPGKAGGKGEATAPEAPAVRIQHQPPAEAVAGATVKLTGTVDDDGGRVKGVVLAFRTGAKGRFQTVGASYSLGQFRAQLPGTAVKPPLVEYYLEAVDKGGLPIASRGDAATPLRIAVPNPEGGSVFASPWFWVPVGAVVVGGVITAIVLGTRSAAATPPGGRSTSTVTVNIGE
jgi:hypothetical protein